MLMAPQVTTVSTWNLSVLHEALVILEHRADDHLVEGLITTSKSLSSINIDANVAVPLAVASDPPIANSDVVEDSYQGESCSNMISKIIFLS